MVLLEFFMPPQNPLKRLKHLPITDETDETDHLMYKKSLEEVFAVHYIISAMKMIMMRVGGTQKSNQNEIFC